MEFFAVMFLFLIASNLFMYKAFSCDDEDSGRFSKCLVQFTNSTSILDNIYTPDNASYSSFYISSIHNLRPEASASKLRAMLVLTPNCESQIQAAVRCSRKLGIQLRVRSGGHDYEGLSYSSRVPFVMIDMRNLRKISINGTTHTAWIQTGATLGEFYYAIAKKSRTLAFPAGACSTVGIGGHFSGGGYSMISRKHGLAIDHIIDARIIIANGSILKRKSMGEDLFWAIRGGGGNSFGIVLAFKVNLVTVPKIVTVFNASRPLEHINAAKLIHKWQHVFPKIDENLVLRIFLRVTVSPTTGKRTILAFFACMYLGRVLDLLPLMHKNFLELGLEEHDCTEMSWIKSVVFFATHNKNMSTKFLLKRSEPNLWYYKAKSDFVRQPIPEHGLKGFWKFFEEQVENHVELQLTPYGGMINKVLESQTPFPHREGTLYMIHYSVYWSREHISDSKRLMDWIRRLYLYMTPYVPNSPRTAYLNYRDLDIGKNRLHGNTSYREASIWGLRYFKNNFDRLVQVKTKVDPSNLFRNEQSIPPYHLRSTKS